MVNEWISWCQTKWFPVMHASLLPVLGYSKDLDQKTYSKAVSDAKSVAKELDTHLHDREWIVGGETMTLADIYVGTSFIFCFQTYFDKGCRIGMPNLAKWFDRFINDKHVKDNFGIIKPCDKAMKPDFSQ